MADGSLERRLRCCGVIAAAREAASSKMGGVVGAVVGCYAWLGGVSGKEEATREEKLEMTAVC